MGTLMSDNGMKDRETNCLDVNTAYYGYNIVVLETNSDSIDCQQRCKRMNKCKFWTWSGADHYEKCFLKTSKDGEPALVKIYGPVYPGNKKHDVSGSKHCTHSSNDVYPTVATIQASKSNNVDRTSEPEKQKGNIRKSAVEKGVNHENNDNLISMGTLMSDNDMKDRETNCLDVNTAYYGYNIVVLKTNSDSIDCQQRCKRMNRCKFWSWSDQYEKCFLKTRKDGEPALVKIYGPVYPGNNKHYVSGSKHCTHETSEAKKQKGKIRKSSEVNEVNHVNNDNLMSDNDMKDKENLDKSISMGFVEGGNGDENELSGKLVQDGERKNDFNISFFKLH